MRDEGNNFFLKSIQIAWRKQLISEDCSYNTSVYKMRDEELQRKKELQDKIEKQWNMID